MTTQTLRSVRVRGAVFSRVSSIMRCSVTCHRTSQEISMEKFVFQWFGRKEQEDKVFQ